MSGIVLLPAVNVVLFNPRKEVLLTLRSAKVREPHKWCLPGGHLDPGERWWQAAQREVREETGLIAQSGYLLGIYSDPALTITEEGLEGETKGQYLVATFVVDSFKGEVKPNDEVEDWDWFLPTHLPDPILRSHPVRVQDALKGRVGGKAYIR